MLKTSRGAMEQRRADAFFKAVDSFVSEEHWTTVAWSGHDSLSMMSSPLGELLKFDLRHLHIAGAQAARDVLVRPEVRAQVVTDWGGGLDFPFKNTLRARLSETLAPGQAKVEMECWTTVQSKLVLLFGAAGPFQSSSFRGKQPQAVLQELRKDCPALGDATLGWFQPKDSCFLLTLRNEPEPERFRSTVVFTGATRFAGWSPKILAEFIDLTRYTFESFMNRPGIQELRLVDAKWYLVLSLRSFNRGPPMLPAQTGSVSISAKDTRLRSWNKFFIEGKVRLADYLRAFLQCLGHELMTYPVLDGRSLVPYQCVVERAAWQDLRAIFLDAFRLQKAAYRRANGGTTAPTLTEDVRPRFVEEKRGREEEVVACLPKLVVRKTFLELEEPPLTMTRSRSEERALDVYCTVY